MSLKIASILEKISKEKSRGNHSKALKYISSAIESYPGELKLYTEAIELSLDAGDPLHSVQYLKMALSRFTGDRETLWEFALSQEKRFSDPVFGKYLLEQSIRNRNLLAGHLLMRYIDDRTAEDLLSRTLKKKETLSSALRSGHKLSEELLLNQLLQAFLNLRLGDISDAVEGFVRHLDAQPKEWVSFEPLLLELEKMYPKKGDVRYALGYCYLLSKQTDKGMKKIMQAIKLNPALVKDIIRLLELEKTKNTSPAESLDITLLEAYLIQGDVAKASTQAQSILDAKPHKTQLVLDIIQSLFNDGNISGELEQLYLDASIHSGQTQRVLTYLKKHCENPEKQRDLFDWLDAQMKDDALPIEVQIFFGEKVLNEGWVDWAIKIFRQAASMFPSDAPTIAHIIDKQQHSDPKLKVLSEELGGKPEVAADTGEFDIQYFEKSEFILSNYQVEKEEPSSEPIKQPLGGISKDQISKLVNQVDDIMLAEDTVEAAKQEVEETDPEPPPKAAKETADQPPPLDPPGEFDFTYRRFLDKELDNDAILELIEKAFDLGRLDEVKSLLEFRPVTIREEVIRILRLAEYYLHRDQPLSALTALKSFDIKMTSETEKREFLTKLASCYRELKMFDAAHSTLLQLLNIDPSDSKIEKLAIKNYRDYLNECCEGLPVLEKVSPITQ